MKDRTIYENVEIPHHYAVSTTLMEKSYNIFTVQTKLKSNEKIIVVDRRFSDFEWLHKYFSENLNYQVFEFFIIKKSLKGVDFAKIA